ncbi:hypothetical protein OG21DRAFT_1442944 [Imleria badia]|nr:hypothetical protein OG21DRAFT_1442944 [Imleria badia]
MSRTSTIPDATLSENAFYIGMDMELILYGIELVLYFKTMRVFQARRREPRDFDAFYAVFSTVMVILITIWVSADVMLGQKMWLLDRNYPGGPMAYLGAHPSIVGATAVLILQQMADSLMIYRCRTVWDSRRAIIIPCILLLVTLFLGIVVIWVSRAPRTNFNFFNGFTAEFAYYLVSMFLNATLTCMICYRLLCYAKTVQEHLGDQCASPYFTITMLLVESVLPYTISGIAFLVSCGVGSETAITFSRVCALMMCVSPQMLILRVAEGKAWQKESTGRPLSAIIFSSSCGTTTWDEERCNGTRTSGDYNA